jgi:3-hydroxybutyryl-CoA dehydrogenase
MLGHGMRVIAFTRNEETHAQAKQYIEQAIDELIERADFSASLRDDWRQRYTPTRDLSQMRECTFVIESVIEDANAKRRVFDAIEAVVTADVPIASNTSALPITLLQRDRKHPQRLLGMHWAEPSHITRFMELIRGEQTSDEAFEAAAALGRRVGKDPSFVNKDVPGFVVNRIGYAIYREALNILESGIADVETIDRSCRNALGLWAAICGPFRWMDLTGGPAAYARAMAPVLPTLSNNTQVPAVLQQLAQSDAQGVTNGKGFFNYTPDQAKRWEKLLREHTWTICELMDAHFPLHNERDET